MKEKVLRKPFHTKVLFKPMQKRTHRYQCRVKTGRKTEVIPIHRRRKKKEKKKEKKKKKRCLNAVFHRAI